MRIMRAVAFWLATAAAVFSVTLPGRETLMWSCIAEAQEDWKNEFEDVCSKTQDSMTLSSDELRALVVRCDKLKPLIEKLDDTQRKVYLKRLQLCRDLLFFVLESKEKK